MAARFVEDAYDIKKLIRHIMTSKAYQSKPVILKSDPGENS